VTVRIGVLALQGDFREHLAAVGRVGVDGVEVRSVEDLEGIDAVIFPGGESTTIGKLAVRYGLLEPLRRRIAGGLPALGTCAGMILLAGGISDREQPQLGVLDVVVARNAFGRQVDSFEEDLAVDGWDEPIRAVYIRAPWVEKVGGDVEILARSHGHPVMVQQGAILATAFHPEITADDRVHRMLVELAEES